MLARLGVAAFFVVLLAPTSGRPEDAGGAAAASRSRLPAAQILHVRSDPHFAAWQAALTRQSQATAARLRADPTSDCGSYDGLRQEELLKHRLRLQLVASLTRGGIQAAPVPPGTAPWPWAAGPHPAALDTAGTAILVDDGRIVFVDQRFEPEVDPVQAARAFYATHDDEYDFLVLFTNFYSDLAGGALSAYHIPVANDVEGLGYAWETSGEHFNEDSTYTGKSPPGRLQSLLHLNNLDLYPDDPEAIYRRNYTTAAFFGHELGHRWLARVRLAHGAADLLGRQGVHWSFFFDSGASVLEGNAWGPDGARYRTLDATSRYGPLDLYLMGMLGPAEVPAEALWYLRNPGNFSPPIDLAGNPFDRTSPPQIGVGCAGDSTRFTLGDIVQWNGARLPAYPDAPRDFRVAIALVTLDSVRGHDLDELGRIRSSFERFFRTSTLGRGSVSFDLRSLPARLLFVHHPQGDVEDSARPTTIRTRLELQQRSLRTRLEDVRVSLFYGVDGGPFVALPMQSAAPGEFAGDVPPQPLGSTVRYWLQAGSDFPGHEFRWPADAPAGTFSFRVRADTLPPVVQFLPRSRWSRFAAPPLWRALVRDEHSVAEVRVDYRLGSQGPWESKALAVQGASDVYETRFELPGSVGDVLEYRIVAEDAASPPHRTTAPATGSYTLEWTRTLVEDAEQEEPMWTHRSLRPFGPEQWHREIVSWHSGRWSWKVGPKNNTAPGVIAPLQDAVLEGPAVRLFDDAQFGFWHHYSFLLDPFDPRHYAMDGGILEWQDVNIEEDVRADRWWVLLPDSGYAHQIGVESFASLKWYPVFSGLEPFWRLETCSDDLRRPELANHTIRFRFRVSTSSTDPWRPAKDGWFIDDIVIDPGTPTTAVTLEAFAAERRADGVRLDWKARDVESGAAFRIYRAAMAVAAGGSARRASPADPPVFVQIGTVNAESGRTDYAFDDHEARADEAYAYRLGLVGRGGERLSQEVSVGGAAPRFALHANWPNPFNPTTEIRFELARRGPARLAVYDPGGRHVRDLVAGVLDAGPHQVEWDGTDGGGRPVASGVYFYRLASGGRSAVHRMVLLR